MNMTKILRIRFIPDEIVDLSKDELLFRDAEYLVTAWTPIHPREDIHHGISVAFLNKGIKVSRFMDAAGAIIYWYIDLVDFHYDEPTDTYRLYDLLADVKIHRDGRVEVIDLDELADAIEQELISRDQGIRTLRILHSLLDDIRAGVQPALTQSLMDTFMK